MQLTQKTIIITMWSQTFLIRFSAGLKSALNCSFLRLLSSWSSSQQYRKSFTRTHICASQNHHGEL